MMAPETVVTVDHNKPSPHGQQAPPQQGAGSGGTLDWIKINMDYFKTPPGILKIIELVLGILCMALATPYFAAFFIFVAVTSFITTLMWTFVYFLSIPDALKLPINWILSELISTGMETFLYLIAFIVLFANAAPYAYGSNIAAAVFGMFNTIAYAASAFLLYKEHKSSTGATA